MHGYCWCYPVASGRCQVDIALNLIGETLYRARRYIQMPFRTIQQREALAKPSAFFHRHRRALLCNIEQAGTRDEDDNFQATPERDFDKASECLSVSNPSENAPCSKMFQEFSAPDRGSNRKVIPTLAEFFYSSCTTFPETALAGQSSSLSLYRSCTSYNNISLHQPARTRFINPYSQYPNRLAFGARIQLFNN